MTSERVRTLCGLVAGVGLLAVVVLLLKPVDASFEDDELLRLQAFDRPLGSLPTQVDCGGVVSSLRDPSSAASLYTIARDNACQREGYRRLMAAVAAASAVVVLTLLLLLSSGIWVPSERQPSPASPNPDRRGGAGPPAGAPQADVPAVTPGDEDR